MPDTLISRGRPLVSATPRPIVITIDGPAGTGKSSVARALARDYALSVVGNPLPGLAEPVSILRALVLSMRRPLGRPFSIWHVRRNSEMLVALLARKVLRLPIRTISVGPGRNQVVLR